MAALGASVPLAVAVVATVSAGPAAASALPVAPRSTASDPRATFHTGNATTCAAAGFSSSEQVGSPTNSSESDVNITGTVARNAGVIHPGQGEELNVAINAGARVTVDAVVVKGGNGFNVYSAASVLPPRLPPDQHYISPFTGGGNVPTISHWFVCYRLADPQPTGSLGVSKTVIAPDGVPVSPLPHGYTALVNCNDGIPAHQNARVIFLAGGGRGFPTLTGIPLGTVCTVVENNAALLPAGTVVSYTPRGVDVTGVTITNTAAVEVDITNDFSALAVRTGSVQLAKVLVNPSGVATPTSYTAYVVCNDGVTAADVTLPGRGGTGSPVLHPKVGFDCVLEELSVPAGWTVRYSVDGAPGSPVPPVFTITSDTVTVAVSVINDVPAVEPSSGGSPSGSASVGEHASGTEAFVPGPGLTGDAPARGGLPLAAMLLAGLTALVVIARLLAMRSGRRRGKRV